MKYSIVSIMICIVFSLTGFTTDNIKLKNKELPDSTFVGVSLKKAMKILLPDSNWKLIQEPPGIYRGVIIKLGESEKIQLYIDRTVVRVRAKKRFFESPNYKMLIWKKIRCRKIIGLIWSRGSSYKIIGNVINHYRPDRI
ncbi:MAG: hypothetical protein ABJG68_07590 [Crocinitomicaceae bacterium]